MPEGEGEHQNILENANLNTQQRRWMLISKGLAEGKPLDQALTLAHQCEQFIAGQGQYATEHHS